MKTEIVPFVFDRALKAIRKDRLAFCEVIDSLGQPLGTPRLFYSSVRVSSWRSTK
jgi:hypothetical protein